MSLRLRVKYKYRSLINAIRYFLMSITLPSWLTDTRAKFTLVGLVAVMGVAFVFQTSSLGTTGYEVHALEQQVAELNSEIQKISTSVAEQQSLKNIQSRIKDSGMVTATNIKYVNSGVETAVAHR